MRLLRFLLLAAGLGLAASPARAFTPQTIVLDGVNDFDPDNLLSDDRDDTQQGCSPAALPMDLGRVYVTNDNNYLYIGVEFSKTCYCDMNMGLAIDVNSAGGGVTDPFGRKIGWANLAFKPDWVVYDVTPTNCNTFNYEILYKDSLGTWYNRSQYVNPAWGSGSDGLGIADGDNFKEIRLPLSVLGAAVGTPLRLELWVTQEGTTKGPLDALCSDNVQMSRPSTTTYDTTDVVQMTCQIPFTVLNAVDNTPPTVSTALATGFTLLASKQFALGTNKVDVTFSEPVDLATAQNTANYAYSGPVSRSVIGAVRDGAALNVVHLTLNSAISANAAFHNITVTNVQDLSTNAIVANGTTNVGSGFIQNVTFNGNMSLNICSGNFAATDTFAIEGNVSPLTFDLCDNAFMYDANGDSVFSVTVPFSLPKGGGGLATADLEWKMTRLCSLYEPFPGNRLYSLSSANGSAVSINVAWNNDDPSMFISTATTVRFRVDATLFNPTGGDVITLLGNIAPLSFTQPGIPMLDNGVAPDAVAGDKIYTADVTFPKCSSRGIEWKVDWNGLIECADQGNRAVFLGPEVEGTTVTLPVRSIDRCTVTDKAIAVTFRVDMATADPDPLPADSVAVMGDRLPLSFATPPSAVQIMANDGVPPDASGGDRVWSRTVIFPDSTPVRVEYKYWYNRWPVNGGFECEGFGNRAFVLDDLQYSVGNPLVLVQNGWNHCSQSVGVPDLPLPDGGGTAFAVLKPSFPVPFSGRTSIHFDLRQGGHVRVAIFDVSGRRVATLLDGELSPGPQSLTWDGRDERGGRMRSGVYLAVLSMGGERMTGRLVLAR